jgi:O-antigen/teichoic acid export membrane protein
MNDLKTLLRQSSHYFVGRMGVILLGFVSFPLFTRLLSVSDYGTMSLVMKLVASFTAVAKMGIQNSALRFYQDHAASNDRNSLKKYFSTLFFGSLGISGAVALAFIAGVWLTPGSLLTPFLKHLLAFGAILIFTGGLGSVLSGFLRVEERTKTYNVLDVCQKVTTIAAVCSFFFFWRSNVWAFFAGTILMDVVVTAGVVVFLMKRGLLVPKLFDSQLFRTAMAFGSPLVIYEFSMYILDSADRLFVQHYLGPLQLGYYSAAYNMAVYVEGAVLIPLNLTLFPLYMRIWVNKGKEDTQAFLSRSLQLYLALIVGVIGTVILTAHDAIHVLASAKYQQAEKLMPLLIVGVMLYTLQIFVGAGLLIHRKTFTMAKMVLYASAFNIALNFLLIPRIGLQGAAIATVLSYLFFIGILGRASAKVLPIHIEYGAIARYMAATAAVAASLWRVNLGFALGTLVTKGLLCMSLYAAIIWFFDPGIRKLLLETLGAGKTTAVGRTPGVGEVSPVAKD